MADRKKVAISYICIFLSVYFLFIAYSAIISLSNEVGSYELPQGEAINGTADAISDVGSVTGIIVVILIAGILVLVLNSFGAAAMRGAMS